MSFFILEDFLESVHLSQQDKNTKKTSNDKHKVCATNTAYKC